MREKFRLNHKRVNTQIFALNYKIKKIQKTKQNETKQNKTKNTQKSKYREKDLNKRPKQ